MEAFFTKCTLITLAALAPAALHAQNSYAIVAGHAAITLTPSVLNQLAAVDVTVTPLFPTPRQKGATILPALEGVIDLDTSFNEVVYGGGFQFKSAANVIQVRNLTLDLDLGPNGVSAIFYGTVVKNGAFFGREAIFSIVATGAGPALPIVPVNGTISHNGLSLSFEQPFLAVLNGTFANSGLTSNTTIGNLDLYSVLAPLTPVANPWPGPYGPFTR